MVDSVVVSSVFLIQEAAYVGVRHLHECLSVSFLRELGERVHRANC